MDKGDKRIFYTSGRIQTHLFRIGIPTILANLILVAYPAYNIFIAGKMLNTLAVSAITISFPLQSLLVMMPSAFGIGGGVLTAYYWGAKNRSEANRFAINTMGSAILVSLPIATLSFILAGQIAHFLNVPDIIYSCAVAYIRIALISSLITGCFLALSSILRSIGDARTPLVLACLSFFFNIVLLPIAILRNSTDWEVGVLAIAYVNLFTQIATGVLWIGMSWKRIKSLRSHLKKLKLDRISCQRISSISFPALLRSFSLSAGVFAITSIAGTFGPTVIAALGVGALIADLTMVPLSAIGACLIAIVGQNLGLKSDKRVREALISGIWMITPIVLIWVAVLIFFPKVFVSVFIDDSTARIITETYVRIIGIATVFYGFVILPDSILIALGKTKTVLACSALSIFAARIPSAFMLSKTSIGETGIWISYLIGGLIAFVLSYSFLAHLKGQYLPHVNSNIR